MTPLLFAIASAAGLVVAGGAGAVQARVAPVYDAPAPQQTQPAQAPASITSEILVLHGTNNNSGIDPKIGKLPELSKPPLSAYNSYKLLDRTSVTLAKGKPSTYKLPNGRELRVVYKDVNPQGKPGDPVRFVYTAIIEANGKVVNSTDYVAKAGEWFWLGGQDYQGGGLVLGFKITP
jgi:hypothetical protein